MGFTIKDLVCRYEDGQPVLKVDNISVPKGSLCFVIGASGIGKSTLLETLGLMNDTISTGENTIFNFSSLKGEIHDLKDIWNSSNKKIAHFRNQYFSFIFQHTNLMPHFTAGENMIISQLISGIDSEMARTDVLKVMAKLNMDKNFYDRDITELSGGQRQRLAFVRAFTATFEVLFGDEPTGNLDPITSEILLNLLREFLKENNKSGIIVSHDIDHAIKFADKILPIRLKSSENNNDFGWMDESICWIRQDGNQWENKGNRMKSSSLKVVLMEDLSKDIKVQTAVKDE